MLIYQSRMAAMGELVGFIAHQWRQPLNLLAILIQNMEGVYEVGEFTEEYLQRTVTETMEVVKQMSETVDQFRNFFKPAQERVPFRVAEEVAKTTKLLGAYFREIGLDLEMVTEDDVVGVGFPDQYAQVLLNILLNARDVFVERKVAHPRIAITISGQQTKAVMTVADNAGGIASEIIDRVFDPYFTTKGEKGTGIALYIARLIIERNMNGRLSVSNTDEGAKFTVEIEAAVQRP